MAKRIYLQSAIIWAILISLITAGTPIFLYFAYSNKLGAITITGKSWTEYCIATSWNEEGICEAYINFTANEDTFWYPVDYDSWGRSTPYNFDPAVKEWKLERKWGNGWREIPLTKPCTGTWCGLSNSNDKRLFSVAWRKGKTYETRIRAIKGNSTDNIYWSLGDFDPIWYGINVLTIEKCNTNQEIVDIEILRKCSDKINIDLIDNITKTNITIIHISNYSCVTGYFKDYRNQTICKDIGHQVEDTKIYWGKLGYKCNLENLVLSCDSVYDGNGNGICTSGESCIEINIKDLSKKERLDTKSLKKIKYE